MTSKLKDAAVKPIGRLVQLPLTALVPDPNNRNTGTPEETRSLARSITEMGLFYPLIVRRLEGEERYAIKAGERRYKALVLLEVASAPCILLAGESGERADLVGAVENHQRKQLSALEEAAAVRGLLDSGWDIPTISRSLGRSKAWVSRRASLTELSERWVQEVKNESESESHKISQWPPSHLEIIARFPVEVQDRMLDTYAFALQRNVPKLSELIEVTGEYQRLLGTVPWDLSDETLYPEAGACTACPKRSAHHPELFPEELPGGVKADSNDRCLDTDCWNCKARVFVIRKVEEARRIHPKIVLLNASERAEGAEISRELPERLVQSGDVATCRKSDENAVPAVIIAGPGLGRIKYIQNPFSNGHGSSSNHHERTEAPPLEEPAVRSLEERRAPYDKRRRQVVIEAMCERLTVLANEGAWQMAVQYPGGQALAGNGLASKTLRLLTLLLGDYGWHREVAGDSLAWPNVEQWQALSKLRNHDLGREERQAEMLDFCWALLRLSLRTCVSRLTVASGVRDNAPHYSEAETLCALLNIDLTGLRALAAKSVPYAKAWKDEVTDEWPTAVAAAREVKADEDQH